MAVKPIPEGYHSVSPVLIVREGRKAVDFYKKALGATERMFMTDPDGNLAHAEIEVGDSTIMIGAENPEWKNQSPESLGGSPVMIHLYVEDVDTVAQKAVGAGAKLLSPVEDQFYGDRSGRLEDPFGHIWTVSTHKEDVSAEEIEKRAAALFGG